MSVHRSWAILGHWAVHIRHTIRCSALLVKIRFVRVFGSQNIETEAENEAELPKTGNRHRTEKPTFRLGSVQMCLG